MKKLSFVAAIVAMCMTLVGCKSQKNVVVNSEAQFDAEEMWMLVEVQGKDFVPADGIRKINIQFNPEAGTFNGHSGCNRYFGQFKDLGDGKMELGEINATKKACSESINKMESSYIALLRRCDGYRLGEYRLELTQRDKVLLAFEKVVYEK